MQSQAIFENQFFRNIPAVAQELRQRLAQEIDENNSFAEALQEFVDISRETLDPTLSTSAIEELLVQHLLTVRVFCAIFDTPDFTRSNVIARGIEDVLSTYDGDIRDELLSQFDDFYLMIEEAARSLNTPQEKQAFLNNFYERFLQGYSASAADVHGIVYTPQEIVDFMCASVEAVLKDEFGVSMSDAGVTIIDPCVGVGNFMVNIVNRIEPDMLQYKYENELFCNEIMLLPYYVASLNIEHAYQERMGEYRPFKGIALVDTLDTLESNAPKQKDMFS